MLFDEGKKPEVKNLVTLSVNVESRLWHGVCDLFQRPGVRHHLPHPLGISAPPGCPTQPDILAR